MTNEELKIKSLQSEITALHCQMDTFQQDFMKLKENTQKIESERDAIISLIENLLKIILNHYVDKSVDKS